MVSMRDFLKSGGRWLSVGWFWPLVLLALPNCALPVSGIAGPPPAFDPGPSPHDAIMCDIRVPPPASPDDCATEQDANLLPSMSHAAINLNEGQGQSVVVDFSPDALTACNQLPRKVTFQGPFPDGSSICINCATQIPLVYPDNNAACAAKCIDLINQMVVIPADVNVQQFCSTPINAHVSTNFNVPCFTGACNNPAFGDPRRFPEALKWAFADGTSAQQNTLTRTKATTAGSPYDAGDASDPSQLVTTGDSWVDFSASETNLGHAIGFATGSADGDSSLADIDFAAILDSDGFLYIALKGVLLDGMTGTGVGGKAFGQYSVTEHFRIHATDHHDGTATMSLGRLTQQCVPGFQCLGEVTVFMQADVDPHPSYPFRVDASFNAQGASLLFVNLMRIFQ
jgi:hypothetical protein